MKFQQNSQINPVFWYVKLKKLTTKNANTPKVIHRTKYMAIKKAVFSHNKAP